MSTAMKLELYYEGLQNKESSYVMLDSAMDHWTV